MDTPAARRKLPIGIQTLSEIRAGNHYYVDKTGQIIDLIEGSGSAFILSRPRRFGKSLLVDTMKELFEGNRALFTGLAAETRWDWSKRHPVIRLDLSACMADSRERLQQRLHGLLDRQARRFGVSCDRDLISSRFSELIAQVHQQTGQRVVVLVDDCDKPLRAHLDQSATAGELRDGLLDLYSVLKEAGADLHFVFMTGVIPFSRAGIFSGLNHLIDISLDGRHGELCGFTDAEIDRIFAPELPGLDRDQIRHWYSGWNWFGEPVCNPVDVLELLGRREIRSSWFEVGIPPDLIRMLLDRHVHTPDLGRLTLPESMLATLDVTRVEPEVLLYQSGGLTIGDVEQLPCGSLCTLRYPNPGVQTDLNAMLLYLMTGHGSVACAQGLRLHELLQAGNPAALRELIQDFFRSIPPDRATGNARFEGYWASIFYSHFAALGLDIRVEDTTNKGRIDMTVLVAGAVWLFEFKVVELVPEGKALAQIKSRGYADKYRVRGEPIHLIGVEFSKADRNIVGFEVETLAA